MTAKSKIIASIPAINDKSFNTSTESSESFKPGSLFQATNKKSKSTNSDKSCVSSDVTSCIPGGELSLPQEDATHKSSEDIQQQDTPEQSSTGIISNTYEKSKQVTAGALIVNPRQRGNPILKFLRNVAWEYGTIVPDYQLGKTSCALFLSLRYHNLNPKYIHERLKQLGYSFDLRVLLAQVDIKDPHHVLKELAQICLLSDVTLILAFSAEEAGRYLETFKAYENKPPDLIMEKTESNFLSQFTDCITSASKVNKTDAVTLLSTFKSLADIAQQSEENLSLCPGFGAHKAKRLYDVINEPFLKSKKRKT